MNKRAYVPRIGEVDRVCGVALSFGVHITRFPSLKVSYIASLSREKRL